MKTLLFRDLKIGRRADRVLLDLDTVKDGVGFVPGLHLLVAPNGYGKTTLLQTLAGILPIQAGEARMEGGDLPAHGKKLEPEAEVLYVSEYLTFPKFIYPSEWIEFMADGRKASSDELAPWIRDFSLSPLMNRYLGRLSQGERRKVTWLGAHVSRRPVLFLDEPLDGLDLFGIQTARRMLVEWKRQGRIMAVVAHQVSEILDLADEVYLFRDQKLVPWTRVFPAEPAAQLPSDRFREKVLEFYSKAKE